MCGPDDGEKSKVLVFNYGAPAQYGRHDADALTVKEAELSIMRRIGISEESLLITQGNLASTYFALGREEEALSMLRDAYLGRLKLYGLEHGKTLLTAYNYANSLGDGQRFEEAKSLLRKSIPVARRVLGKVHEITLRMEANYAAALVNAGGATLDDLREAVTIYEDTGRAARRVLGGAHPITEIVGRNLLETRAAIHARETSSGTG